MKLIKNTKVQTGQHILFYFKCDVHVHAIVKNKFIRCLLVGIVIFLCETGCFCLILNDDPKKISHARY